MPDIFISYSRKDSAQALELAEKLRAFGMGVWIDQRGIEAATSWSGEIADAIRTTKAFVLLLSASSTESPNVKKELGVATEVGCSLVPVEIEKIELNRDFLYHLAGLQRVAIDDFDGITRALEKIGVARVSTRSQEKRVETRSTPRDDRKSLIVLPFEDLSPSGEDNAWFADGLAGEMIDALGHIKSLRILDRKTSIGLRGAKLRTVEIGKEFSTRYFIEGSVRKFGEQIKISVSLLDIETGDYLWQESHRGEFKDIFDIQEMLADKVVEGLKLHLTKEEKTLVNERGTENAEAYELAMKADEYFNSNTKEGRELALQVLSEAIKLDPRYWIAYPGKAMALAGIYQIDNRDPALLDEGLKLALEALRLKPDSWRTYNPISIIYNLQGKLDEAEQAANEFVRNAPEDFVSYIALGRFYQQTAQYVKAITQYEIALKLKPDILNVLFSLVLCCDAAKDTNKQKYWAEFAIPKYERHLKMFPKDEDKLVIHVVLLHFAGRDTEARNAARLLENIKDGGALYNIACLQCDLVDYESGIRSFFKAIEAGFRQIEKIKEFLNDGKSGIGKLKGTPEYEEVCAMVEKLSEPLSEP